MPRKRILEAGSVVADYALIGHIGGGHEGDVYKARIVGGRKIVTVKVVRNSEPLENFHHTVKHLIKYRRTEHFKRVLAHGVIEPAKAEAQYRWIAFEYIRGVRLDEYVNEGRVKRPIWMAMKILDALVTIHRHRISIGDFDAGRNILIESRTGRVVFVDCDAGEPGVHPPGKEEDVEQVLKLLRRMWRVNGAEPDKMIVAALKAAALKDKPRDRPAAFALKLIESELRRR